VTFYVELSSRVFLSTCTEDCYDTSERGPCVCWLSVLTLSADLRVL